MSESNNTLTSSELFEKAEGALTPEQYARLKSKALDKIGLIKLSSMNLAELKSELPRLTQGDPEEQDIMTRLEGAFGGRPPEKPSTQFLKNPLDYIGEKATSAKNTLVDGAVNLLPDQVQAAMKASDHGASTVAVAATAILGESTGKTIEQAEKATSFLTKLRVDPMGAIKELFSSFMEAFKTGDWSQLKSFFSFGTSIDTDLVKTFGEKIGIPKDLLRSATSFFANDSVSQLSFENLQKLYGRYQKNPELNLIKELNLSGGDNTEIASYLNTVFGKKGPDVSSLFPNITDLSKLSVGDVIKKTMMN